LLKYVNILVLFQTGTFI